MSMMIFINMFKLVLFMLTFMNLLYMNKMILTHYQILIILNETFFNFNENLTLTFDLYSMSFSIIVSIVVVNVLSFMNIYMNKNVNMKVFFFMTKMFVVSMFLLIHSFNLWTMILGWEGLGVTSFYLIFYYNNSDSWKSAIKTFINNKLGDCMLIISMMILVLTHNSTKMVTMMFFLAMMTKSAQYPFMAWLPMAMSAPTPISAMVHSSTLVTAGLFIMFRLMSNFLMKSNMNVILNLCLMSMFISGMKAITEKDMKKMIALSTLSQISLIFFFLAMNMKNLAFMYMCNHALFKSLMFINMGMMMSSNYSSQLNFLMNNSNVMYMNILSYKISCLNLMNMSFFSSFFIKEKMILSMETNFLSQMKFVVFVINSFLTMNYSLKMIFFFNQSNSKKKENFTINTKSYKLSFFLVNMLSVVFSKMMMYFFLCDDTMNICMLMFYIFTLTINYKNYKNSFFLLKSLAYLNFMIFVFPFKMKKSMDMNELWMEKLSLNFYFFFKNKLLYKSFNMNYKMIMILFLILMFL